MRARTALAGLALAFVPVGLPALHATPVEAAEGWHPFLGAAPRYDTFNYLLPKADQSYGDWRPCRRAWCVGTEVIGKYDRWTETGTFLWRSEAYIPGAPPVLHHARIRITVNTVFDYAPIYIRSDGTVPRQARVRVPRFIDSCYTILDSHRSSYDDLGHIKLRAHFYPEEDPSERLDVHFRIPSGDGETFCATKKVKKRHRLVIALSRKPGWAAEFLPVSDYGNGGSATPAERRQSDRVRTHLRRNQ